ncbi:hypothetical protein ACJMK2_016699 [Sinanodonta woodiana]|uniref:C1q domain-containing protein n=1 Tax=Sinanodonta woodiana TaxID=1069815 RepID=A0ABD3UUI3_SINWO
MWFVCIFIISVQLCHGILDGMTGSDVGAVKLRLEEEKEKRLLLQNDVEILMLKVATMERKLEKDADGKTERKLEKDADGASSTSRTVAFMAYRVRSLTHIELNQKLVFDKVATNEGNGYSAITGTFTAPISGYYYFTWMTSHAKTGVSPDNDLVTGIFVNGDYKIPSASVVIDTMIMGFNSAVFRLNATDIVWIGVSKGIGKYSNSNQYCYYPTFIGIFVSS